MTDQITPELEREYLTPAMARDFSGSVAAWAEHAAAYREAVGSRAQLDVAYGEAPRQRLDIFPGEGRGVALFIHGGYWQFMDRSHFSHMARGANEHGITVVVAGYTLCPETTLAGIVEELRRAVAFTAKRFAAPVTVFGHSAGGHLTACMLATKWAEIDPVLDSRTVSAGMPISGIFELEPLVRTSLNRKLRLDPAQARRLSPLFWDPPVGNTLDAYVGGEESAEFKRQTASLVERWSAAGVRARAVELAGVDHFPIIGALADPDSAMTRNLVALVRATLR